MSKRRVVITGMGIVSPVGSQLDEAWRNICEGRSGIGPIQAFDATDFATRIGGAVQGFSVDDFLSPKDARKMDTFMHYGIGASIMAMRDAELEVNDANGHRVGVAMGCGGPARSSCGARRSRP